MSHRALLRSGGHLSTRIMDTLDHTQPIEERAGSKTTPELRGACDGSTEQLGALQSRLGDVTTGPNERIGPSVATAHFLYLLRREVRHLSGRSKDWMFLCEVDQSPRLRPARNFQKHGSSPSGDLASRHPSARLQEINITLASAKTTSRGRQVRVLSARAI